MKTVFYEPPAADPEEIDFRHSHWAVKRRLVNQCLILAGTGKTQIEAFENCGSDAWVKYSKEAERYKMVQNCCHNRHCEPCMRAKANLMAANLRNKLEERPGLKYRFITLTLKHSDTPLRDQIDRLYSCFKKLRAERTWKESQTGGAAILEVKWNADTGEWHPHLHLIAEGEFLRQQALAEMWYAITGDSFKVDIRLIHGSKDAVHYVSKYLGKGVNNEVWINGDAGIEWILAMKGTRTAATYGSWRGFKLLEHPKDEYTYEPIGRLTDIMRRANAGEPFYVRLIDVLRLNLQYNPHKKRDKKGDGPLDEVHNKFLP